MRPEAKQPGPSSGTKDAAIIKFGQVMLWDRGLANSPGAIIKRPSNRDLRSPQTWRRVSCILRDNGEFSLVTENDAAVPSIIELSQLGRSAIQQLDKSALDEEYCVSIFPIYASTSTQLSIFRPVYLALDSRVLFEVWFVLLRAFTIPEVYGLDASNDNQIREVIDLKAEPNGELFRVEKTVMVRVTEAKLRSRTEGGIVHDRAARGERGPACWQLSGRDGLGRRGPSSDDNEDGYQIAVLARRLRIHRSSSHPPVFSVVLKRVDGNLEQPKPPNPGIPRTAKDGESNRSCLRIC